MYLKFYNENEKGKGTRGNNFIIQPNDIWANYIALIHYKLLFIRNINALFCPLKK